jgi:MscS family membrane protein
MAAALIDNKAMRSCRRFRLLVSMAYGTPPDRMIAFRDGLREFASGHPRVRQDKIEIHIANLGASCVDLLVQVYFSVMTYTDEMVCRDEVSREILAQAERLGVEIAFPTQTIHVAGLEAGAHDVPPPPKLLGRDRLEARRPGDTHPRMPDPAPSIDGDLIR